jgi:hypothetical protein
MAKLKVFRLRLNSNVFRSLLPVDQKIWQGHTLSMDCRSKLPDWKPPAVYFGNPMLKPGNFLHFASGAFVLDSSGCEALRTILEMAGELLPLRHEDADFHLMNVLECVNCLDPQRTQWVRGKATNAKIRIKEYHFEPSHFSESTLFKIPETALGEVLTVSGLKDQDDEFKSVVERRGLEGIVFEEIWADS